MKSLLNLFFSPPCNDDNECERIVKTQATHHTPRKAIHHPLVVVRMNPIGIEACAEVCRLGRIELEEYGEEIGEEREGLGGE